MYMSPYGLHNEHFRMMCKRRTSWISMIFGTSLEPSQCVGLAQNREG